MIVLPTSAHSGTTLLIEIPPESITAETSAVIAGALDGRTLRGAQMRYAAADGSTGDGWTAVFPVQADGSVNVLWAIADDFPFGAARISLRAVYAVNDDDDYPDAIYFHIGDGDVFVYGAAAGLSQDKKDLAVLRYERGLRISDKGTTLSYSVAGRSVASIPLSEIEDVISRLEGRINSQRGIVRHRMF